MDIDQWLKLAHLALTAFFGATTAWLGIRQYLDGNKTARREEYKFAKLFFDELKQHPPMHAYARKKGFQAIGRNQDLPPNVIEHLMDLRDPVGALQDYESSRAYLKHTAGRGKRQLDFASTIFSTDRRREFISTLYILGAIFSYIVAFTPWFLKTIEKISTPVAISASAVFSPIGIFFAVILLREFLQLRRAMRLVKMQNQEADSW
ncbi:hypothetical protein [Janthinobacterium sp. HLX7-2]|uniref:hypothetical protein n=1 Tax=Janthinobacterium sp. HLX7-2 TaxID=1259331 RepID=UPI003F218C4F